MRVALIDLIPVFERATKHKIAAIYGAPGRSETASWPANR